ncbi:MAG: hypothetical protein ACFCU6_09910 [Balneolaceae bacterium]
MNKYRFLYLIWLLPAYFVWQIGYQAIIYNGLIDTYDNGDSHMAEVIDFDIKQIAAQTNGYVVLRFTNSAHEILEEKLSLPVQMAQVIMDSEYIPVRYKKTSLKPIVMLPIFELQKNVLLVNIGVSALSLTVVILIALWTTRYANRIIRDGEEILQIEQV